MRLHRALTRLALSLLTLLIKPAHKGVFASVNENQIEAIASYVDPLINPCDDYYRYACGNWANVHSNEQYYEVTSLMDHKVNKRLIDYFQNYQLEGSAEAGNETYTDKLFLYYQTCRRTKGLQLKRYLQLVRPSSHLDWQLMLEVREPNATWPAERFNWLFTLAKLRRYRFKGALFEHILLEDESDSNRYLIDLDKPTDKLPDEIVIAALLIELGVARVRAIEVAKQLHKFEERLMILRETEDKTGPQPISLSKLKDEMPEVPWQLYLQLVLSYTLTEDYEVQINNREYFPALNKVLSNTEPSLIDNYIMVKFALFLMKDSADNFTKMDCMWDVRKKMELAVNFLYKQQFYGGSDAKYIADVERIFNLTRREFSARLKNNRMKLLPNQLAFLQVKLTAMRFNIGNLPASVDERFIDKYYADVHIDPNNYHKNHLLLLKLRSRKEHDQLTAPAPSPSDYHFISDGDSCTPYYMFRKNLVIIPYAFLQPPAYHVNMHDIMKMGIFGFVLTHEIMHGFEYSGVHFDFSGITDWLGKSILSDEEFVSGFECLNYPKTDSLDERAADFMGIRVAYDTLFHPNSSMNARQPSFTDITPRRLFFLNVAQFFCGNLLPTFFDHDADDVRLRQTLKQFEAFTLEYECKPGDAMFAEERCELY
ncbi:membrane metallo-endopeptidase-like 1 [Bactrocera neohumeralis]|uniref:membrane metallo-endopeptidase-like 1 n=1 Tax=Bactrocera neohumeralis TaxID=98809 RepID=UPI0021659215|nr:membrane metallo-endopeptidase-like 1 [Bactrocera neohumeralis]XP_050321089.1 membrane metallo-endopeptidase-like 1 [Bactrocera neohumeralis]